MKVLRGKKRSALREQMREHQYIKTEFEELPEENKKNDMEPIQKFKNYMKKNYQVRIYIIESQKKMAEEIIKRQKEMSKELIDSLQKRWALFQK